MSLVFVGRLWLFYFTVLGFVCMLSGSYMYCMGFSMFFGWEFYLYGGLGVDYYLVLDWVCLMFLGVVFFVSAMIFNYSCSYMGGDQDIVRFIYILLFFVVSMGLLVISPSIISILLGWDGLGLVSYCLVIYYGNFKSYGAGMLTVLSNRLGDVALLICIGLMVEQGGWGIMNMFLSDWYIFLLILFAGITSSAQMPFSAWLPAAMAAPTPVSALVHSSTLVTAGVYLFIRVGGFMALSVKWGLLYLSLLTMFMAGLCAVFENDLKSIVALSTLSQLGMMMSAISVGAYDMAYCHLLIHAVFKSLLFLCAGYLIHQFGGIQDIRYLGNMGVYCPLVCLFFNVSNFSLCGLPFMSGFYSKDFLVEYMIEGGVGFMGLVLLLVSCGLTVSYTTRLYIFLGVKVLGYSTWEVVGDGDKTMLFSMMMIGVGGIVSGSFMFWLFFGFDVVCLGLIEKLLVIMFMVLGVVVGVYMYGFSKGVSRDFEMFLGGMWYLPLLSVTPVDSFMSLYVIMNKVNEVGWDEFFGGDGVSDFVFLSSTSVMGYQSFNVKVYLWGLFFWVMIFLCLV